MAGSQISTSVSIIDSLSGFMALSLTEYNTSAAAAIAAGSKVEIAGAFFQFPADETPTGWSSITTGTTAYIALTASGTAGSQVVNASYTSTAPTWRDDLQGWYASSASSVRIVASVYKAEATSYYPKLILKSLHNDRWSTAINTPLGSNWETVINEPNSNSYTAGSYIIPGFGNYRPQTWETYTHASTYSKIYEYKVPFTGTFTVSHKLRFQYASPYFIKSRIYVNGVATGTENTLDVSAATAYSENISMNSGDLIQLYGYCSIVNRPLEVTSFCICSGGYGEYFGS